MPARTRFRGGLLLLATTANGGVGAKILFWLLATLLLRLLASLLPALLPLGT